MSLTPQSWPSLTRRPGWWPGPPGQGTSSPSAAAAAAAPGSVAMMVSGRWSADVRIIKCYQGLDNVDFDKKMFEVCHKPTPGTDMTFAYFHLKPYVFVSSNGAVTAGIEVE